MTLWLSVVTCWFLTQATGVEHPPPLRSLTTNNFKESEANLAVFKRLWLWCRSFSLVIGDNNFAGYGGRKWAPPPHRPQKASVWAGWGGHVPADHTLLPWRAEEHQTVAWQLGITPCMVLLTGQEEYFTQVSEIAHSDWLLILHAGMSTKLPCRICRGVANGTSCVTPGWL